MENWKIYNSEKEWEADGKPWKSYIRQKINFKVTCNKCEGEAVVYEGSEGPHQCQNIIKCSKCGNEIEFYGCDG